jgi:hypothetical protein
MVDQCSCRAAGTAFTDGPVSQGRSAEAEQETCHQQAIGERIPDAVAIDVQIGKVVVNVRRNRGRITTGTALADCTGGESTAVKPEKGADQQQSVRQRLSCTVAVQI